MKYYIEFSIICQHKENAEHILTKANYPAAANGTAPAYPIFLNNSIKVSDWLASSSEAAADSWLDAEFD
jgi:hypothetical protein